MASKKTNGQIPVRVYQSEGLFGIAAPLPGLEPDDIRVTIEGKRVTIHGRERGPHQHDRDLVKAEWTVGPFQREIVLPESVDGSLTNATYGNGVLVLTIPKGKKAGGGSTEITLRRIGLARGERVGYSGRQMQPSSHQHQDLGGTRKAS